MTLIRRLSGTVGGIQYVQFLHRKVSASTLAHMAREIDQNTIVKLLTVVARTKSIDTKGFQFLKESFFPNSGSLSGHLVILSLTATHSYYKGAYQLRKSFLEECIPAYAAAIIESLRETADPLDVKLVKREEKLYI